MKTGIKKPKPIPGAVVTSRMAKGLQLEVISGEARRRILRLLRKVVRATDAEASGQIELIRKNRIINLANGVLGRPIYVLEMSDWDYDLAEYAWHDGEFEVVLRRPNSTQLAEILVDLVEEQLLSASDVNDILAADQVGFRLVQEGDETSIGLVKFKTLPDDELDDAEHGNVRLLVDRMDRALQDQDWSLALHAAASTLETVAKKTVPNPSVQDQSLGGWFDLYRKHSALAAPLLDTVEAIFKRRNVEPLAGHGSVKNPSITREEAIQVRELTVAFLKLEHTLSEAGVTPVSTSHYKSGQQSGKKAKSKAKAGK